MDCLIKSSTHCKESLLTLKKFTKDESSGTSATLGALDDDGSRGPSITAILGTASSSSNSLQPKTSKFFGDVIVLPFVRSLDQDAC